MKRTPELRSLSVDHHHGLVLARRARRVGAGEDSADPAAAWDAIMRVFHTELEPHFQIEEALLVPELVRLGEDSLVRRLLEDHSSLRAAVSSSAARGRPSLLAFGELLVAHIRFEERELFPRVEERFSEAALAAVARASSRPRGAPRSDSAR